MIPLVHAVLAVVSVFNPHPKPKPFWLNNVPSCPAGWSVYAIESRALAGRDSTVCVREVTRSNWPDHTDEDQIHMITEAN